MSTTLLASHSPTPSRSRIGLARRGPPESWIIARSTSQVTISPGVTRSRPQARAMIFSAKVIAIISLATRIP